MSNTNNPSGFQIWDKLLRTNIYPVATAPTIAFYIGDLVQSANTFIACTGGRGARLQVKADAVIQTHPGATFPIIGSVLAVFDYEMNPISTIYMPVATVGDSTLAGYLLVADHPFQQFVAQEDSLGAAIALADMDLNFDVIPPALNAGNTNTGISKQVIDSSSSAVTVTYPLRIVEQAYPLRETAVSDNYTKWVVQINPECHYFGAGTAI